MGKLKRSVPLAVTLAAALAFTTACSTGSTGSDGQELTKLKVATTVVGPTYWPFYHIPQILGYYEEEGLDVDIIPINTGVTQSLLAGQIDIGGAGFDYVQQAGNVTGLEWFMMTDRHLFTPIVLDSSEFQSVSDLAGKKVGINEPNDSFDADFVLAANGIELGNYELIPIGEAAPVTKALVAGDIDAMIIPAGSSFLRAQLAAAPEKLRFLDAPASEGFYNTGLMATEEFLANNRDVAIAFGRAIAKGLIWMYENPEATAEMIMEMEPEASDDLESAKREVKRSVEWNQPIYDMRGEPKSETFKAEVKALFDAGLIDEVYDHETLFDDSYWEEIWSSFDVDAIVKDARAGNWK